MNISQIAFLFPFKIVTMKTSIHLATLLIGISFTVLNAAETVYIPDANFKAALISLGVDVNNDMEIEYDEAEAVTTLDVSSQDISDLTGIEFFINLTVLNCYSNNLTSIDVSNLTALLELRCFDNQLTALDVSQNTQLVKLMCQINQLTALDVSVNTQLTHLYCPNNQLTALDVSNNTGLLYFYCEANALTSIDISTLTALKEIIIHSNELTALDVSNNPALEVLRCQNNAISVLDISANPLLISFKCGGNPLADLNLSQNTALQSFSCSANPLISLDISMNTALTNIALDNMPTLSEVCVWELPFPPESVTLDTTGSPNVVFNMDCVAENIYIPDANFKAALIDLGIDVNDDDEINYTEAEAVDSLDIHDKGISDLTGIEAFVNLIFLWCYDNDLDSIDVSALPLLSNLDCGGNNLTSLDVSSNSQLVELRCYINQITALDISNNPDLIYLDCGSNLFTELDVSSNTSLAQLLCYASGLTTLDITGNTNLEFLNISGIPTLETVCVWTVPFPPAGITVNDSDSPNVEYSTCESAKRNNVSDKLHISVYPNPAEDVLFIACCTEEKFAVTITNIAGMLVYEKQNCQSEEMIHIEYFAPGVYAIHVTKGNEVYTSTLAVR